MTKLKVAFRNFMNAPKKEPSSVCRYTHTLTVLTDSLYWSYPKALYKYAVYIRSAVRPCDAFRPFMSVTSVNLFFVGKSPLLHWTYEYIQHCQKYTEHTGCLKSWIYSRLQVVLILTNIFVFINVKS